MRISAFWPDFDLLDQRLVDVELHLHLGHVGQSEDSLERIDGCTLADLAARVVPGVVGIGDDAVLAGADDGLVFLLDELLQLPLLDVGGASG